MEIGKGRQEFHRKGRRGTAELGWLGMRAWKSFGILVEGEGEGVSKKQRFLVAS
jgi:hypothetical protein